MSKRLMPTYLVKFLEKIYDGEIPSNFGKRMVSRQFIARAKELYDTLGGKNPSDYSRRMVNEYLIKFFNDIEIVEYDDDDISQTKTIPSDLVYPACRIDSIGGMSYKTTNLADNPTITNNVSENFKIFISLDNLSLPAGTYTISFKNTNTLLSGTRYYMEAVPAMSYAYTGAVSTKTDYSITFTTTATTTQLTVRLQYTTGGDTGTVTNVMLNSGSTALPYEPYFTGIRDSAVTAVKSYGANLLDNNNLEIFSNNRYIRTLQNILISPNTTYTFSNSISNGADGLMSILDESLNVIQTIGQSSTNKRLVTFTTASNAKYFKIDRWYMDTTAFTIESAEVMLNYGSTALPYTPYKGLIDTYTVPSAIKSLEGYGQGINSTVYNNVDFANGKYVKNVGTKTYNGSETGWQYNWNVFHIGFSGFKYRANVANFKNNLYTEIAYHGSLTDFINAGDKIMTISENTMYVKDSSITSRADFITFLQNNNLDLYYALATPVETTITEKAPLLEVESGGTVTLENEYNNDVPSEVVTWIKES